MLKIERKLDSLIRRRQSFFSITYDWCKNKIVILPTFQQYIQHLGHLKQIGMIKRSQSYVPKIINIANIDYMIYLISYGEIRPRKFIFGQNPISQSLGVCMFDYVFMFLENLHFARKKIHFRIQRLRKQTRTKDEKQMRNILKLLQIN